MNSERISGQPCEGTASVSPQRGISHDQVAYRGPLKDPTKVSVDAAVRPPPERESQAAPEDPWHMHEEDLQPEYIRHLGRYLYISMFSERLPVVSKDLYRVHDEALARGEVGWKSEVDPIHWPAAEFVALSAIHFGLSAAMLHRFCDAASRDIARQILPTLYEKRSAPSKSWKFLKSPQGEPKREKQIDTDISIIERIAQDGLQGTIIEHLRMQRTAVAYAVELGVPPPSSTPAP